MTPEPETFDFSLSGIAGAKFRGVELRDIPTEDLRFVKRFARGGGVRHEITTIMAARYWATHRRSPQEQRQNWRSRSEAR